MALRSGLSVGLCPLFALTPLIVGATGALAQDRCEGTLCDFYYSHVASPQPKTPATTQPTPASQPSSTAGAPASDGLLGRLFSGGGTPQQQTTSTPPAKRPLVAVQGGGIIGMVQGNAPSRCTGTLCDLYYGGPPPEEPTRRPVPAVAPAVDEPADEATQAPGRGPRAAGPPAKRASCAAGARDPWQCYR